MKRIMLLLLGIFINQLIGAQNYYRDGIYTDGYDLKAGDIVFEVKSGGRTLILRNAANELGGQQITWRDGLLLAEDEYEALEEGELDIPSVKKAFQETFTEPEYRALQAGKDYMSLYMSINPEGRLLEVSFYIELSPRTRAIPPEKYALLEKNLKTYLRYRVSDDEKRLRFFRLDIPIAFRHLGLYDKGSSKVLPGEQPVPGSELH